MKYKTNNLQVQRNLLIIDGSSLLVTNYYANLPFDIMKAKMPEDAEKAYSKILHTSDGKYTNAIYGFLAILFKLLEEETPEYIAVAFDLKAPTARHKLYEGYKANRKGMPEELRPQMPLLKKVLQAMNITTCELGGYEADDLLGTLATRADAIGLAPIIVSGDRDLLQIASDTITIKIPKTKGGSTTIESYNTADA